MYVPLTLSLFTMLSTLGKSQAVVTACADTTQKQILHFRYFPQRSATFFDAASGHEFTRVRLGLRTAKVTNDDNRSVAVDSGERFVYSCYSYFYVMQYRIRQHNILHSLTPSRIAAHSHPMNISLHPNGRFAYVSCSHGAICQYRIARSGHLMPLAPAEVYGSDDPSPLRFDPSGHFACIVADGPDDAGRIVFVYRVNADGTLTLMRQIPSPYIDVGISNIMVQGKKASVGE